MAINKENIQKVIDLMRADDAIRFNMGSYIKSAVTHVDTLEDEEKNWCGTTCCIAGYASVIVNGLEKAILLDDDAYGIGQEFFGITEHQAGFLFTPGCEVLAKATKEQGIKVLENLIETEMVRWSVVGFCSSNDEDYEDYDSTYDEDDYY